LVSAPKQCSNPRGLLARSSASALGILPYSRDNPCMEALRRFVLRSGWLRESIVANALYLVYYLARQRHHARRVGSRTTTPSRLEDFRESDTLFVLGAGSSLNSLTPADWQEIESCDVAGTTSTCVLPIRQTFYFFEGSRDPRVVESMQAALNRVAIDKFRNNRLRVMLWKNPSARQIASLLDMKAFQSPNLSDILATTEKGLSRILRLVLRSGLAQHVFLQKRA
jgi:hypothetical protein